MREGFVAMTSIGGDSLYWYENVTTTGTYIHQGFENISGVIVPVSATPASPDNLIINSNGLQIIYPGALATGATINYAGGQYISGGTASSTTINSGGRQYFAEGAGGLMVGTIVNEGATQYSLWETVIDTTVNGGNQYVNGPAISTTIKWWVSAS
jgi:autotransporter passenger strand-loop-strand repeat protein